MPCALLQTSSCSLLWEPCFCLSASAPMARSSSSSLPSSSKPCLSSGATREAAGICTISKCLQTKAPIPLPMPEASRSPHILKASSPGRPCRAWPELPRQIAMRQRLRSRNTASTSRPGCTKSRRRLQQCASCLPMPTPPIPQPYPARSPGSIPMSSRHSTMRGARLSRRTISSGAYRQTAS